MTGPAALTAASRPHQPTDPGAPGTATALAWLLDRIGQAVLLVDAGACLHFANRVAVDILHAGHGLRLRNGIVEATSLAETRLLHQAVASCAADAVRKAPDHGLPLVCGRAGSAEPSPLLSVCVVPLPSALRGTGHGGPVASLFIADPARTERPSVAQLQASFGLTLAESALALEILAGDGLRAVAGRLGISQTTARTHLGHVFEKTGTKRQAELVRLLLAVRLP
ncbi:helix-turn-helix transcriptional regulator [Azospirillum picis]|uniref:DNA-binding CsgD family transcriptional regulator n=1 Tax=Azospirillum picis TaxID=488438 RepID=A0ABU0MPW1_9PROT|nr:helix-turn-helix transcriptional regulator [Azospirillum picis]MBP2301660.1 DNA-binding CsgD family transcriptional regulator [Azospirillum picis]MDQ0535517.1 DNA-binding CsgD family transcriptional regulator [Azospirillum picis]